MTINNKPIVIISQYPCEPPKIYFTTKLNPYSWNNYTSNSIWFPYAEKFISRFPQIAVRIFYVIIITKTFWKKFWRINNEYK